MHSCCHSVLHTSIHTHTILQNFHDFVNTGPENVLLQNNCSTVTAHVWYKGEIGKKNTICNLTTVGVHVSDVFNQRTYKSLLSHWTSQQTEVLYSAVGNAKYIFWKITTRVISHWPHTHDRYISPTMWHHVHGHHSVLQSSFLLGPLTESNRMD